MRKTKVVIISNEGRDNGKHYVLTEMSAVRAEKWAARAFLALARSGFDVGDDVRGMGMAGIAVIGLRALRNANFEEIEPLMDEMMTCVQLQPDPNKPQVVRPIMADEDIEELSTVLKLREEVFELHTGFSIADALSKSTSALAKPSEDSVTTPTSQEASAQ